MNANANIDPKAEVTPVVQLTKEEIENLPEFKVWADEKKIEARDYVLEAFGMELKLEDLVVRRDNAGWPDPIGRAGTHKIIVSNRPFRDKDGNTLGNYYVWRKLPVKLPVAGSEPGAIA